MGRKSKAQIEAEAQEADAVELEQAEAQEADVIIPEVIEDLPTLVFKSSGWCNELNMSYFKGSYKPSDKEEYNALKKYAK